MIGGSVSEAAEARKSPFGSMSEAMSEAGGSVSEAVVYKKEAKKARMRTRLCGRMRVANSVPVKGDER